MKDLVMELIVAGLSLEIANYFEIFNDEILIDLPNETKVAIKTK